MTLHEQAVLLRAIHRARLLLERAQLECDLRYDPRNVLACVAAVTGAASHDDVAEIIEWLKEHDLEDCIGPGALCDVTG